MPVTVGVNNLSVVHAGSNGIAIAFPDPCLTPTPAGPVPLPYPNIAMSSDTASGSKDVSCDGQSICHASSSFSMSTGDEAGSVGGVASGKFKGKAEFVNYSFDVQVEGKHVARVFDLMLHNDKNTPPFPLLQGPVVAMGATEPPRCVCCREKI